MKVGTPLPQPADIPDATDPFGRAARESPHAHGHHLHAHQKAPALPRNSPLRPRRLAPRRRASRAASGDESEDDFLEFEAEEEGAAAFRQAPPAAAQDDGSDRPGQDSQGDRGNDDDSAGLRSGASPIANWSRAGADGAKAPAGVFNSSTHRALAAAALNTPATFAGMDETALVDALLRLATRDIDGRSRTRTQFEIVRGFMLRREPTADTSRQATLAHVAARLRERQDAGSVAKPGAPSDLAEENRRVLLPLVLLAALRPRPLVQLAAAVSRSDMLSTMNGVAKRVGGVSR